MTSPRISYLLIVWFGLICQFSWAQSTSFPRRVEVEGHLDYDTFFGFYPSIYVSRPLDSLHTITGYGIFYTNPAFFGAETGITVSFATPQRNWTVTPGAGLVSGSVFVEGRSFAVGEGGFGSLAVQFEQSRWYVQGYGAYWGVLQRKTADAYDFAYYFISAGRVMSTNFRVGLVFGQLGNVRLPRNNGDFSEFTTARFGISTTTNLPLSLTLQLGGGLATGNSPATFLQIGLSRSLRHW
jgi:hypothetical protein